jgi:hypothetical protein
MSKAAMGAIVRFCGHRGTFIADIWRIGSVNVIAASRNINPSTINRDFDAYEHATHHMSDFPRAGYWKPEGGIFVVPASQVVELPGLKRRTAK